MFDVFLCVQAFIHAHPHVFALIQTYVYVFLNGIKAFEKNIMTLAAKTHRNKWNISVFCSLQKTRPNAGAVWTTRPPAHQWPDCEKDLQRKSLPWASVAYLIYNEVPSLFRGWMLPSPALQNSHKVFRCFPVLLPTCWEWGASYRCAPLCPTCSQSFTKKHVL